MNLADTFIAASVNTFAANQRLAERAIAQTSEANLSVALDENTNSIAVTMKHIAGNLISRWTDFLTTDGEKPWRDRDNEFIDTFATHEERLAYWERGWTCAIDAIESLSADDLEKTVLIRGEPHTVPLAISRSLGHTCYHVGQIVQIARIHAAANWQTLTIARGESEQFNQQNWGGKEKSHS